MDTKHSDRLTCEVCGDPLADCLERWHQASERVIDGRPIGRAPVERSEADKESTPRRDERY